MKVDTEVVERLRLHLLRLSQDAAHSVPSGTRPAPKSPSESAVLHRFRPFGEFLFLISSADGELDRSEKAVTLGAFRALTRGQVSDQALESLEVPLTAQLEQVGADAMLESVCSALADDREDAELAFILGSTVALADQRLDASEEALLEKLASWLGISEKRAQHLLAGP